MAEGKGPRTTDPGTFDKSGKQRRYKKKLWDKPTFSFRHKVDGEDKVEFYEEFDGLDFRQPDGRVLFRMALIHNTLTDDKGAPLPDSWNNRWEHKAAPFMPADGGKWTIATGQLPDKDRPLYNTAALGPAETAFLVTDTKWIPVVERAMADLPDKFAVSGLAMDRSLGEAWKATRLEDLRRKKVVLLEPVASFLDRDGTATWSLEDDMGRLVRRLWSLDCEVKAASLDEPARAAWGPGADFMQVWGTELDAGRRTALVKAVAARSAEVRITAQDADGEVRTYGRDDDIPLPSPFQQGGARTAENIDSLEDNEFYRLIGPTKEGRYAIYDKRTRMLKMASVSDIGNKGFLIDLAPRHHWMVFTGEETEAKALKRENVELLQEALTMFLKSQPLHHERDIKGLGWHWVNMDSHGQNRRVAVCHCGDKLILDSNKSIPLDEMNSRSDVWIRQDEVDWGDPTASPNANSAKVTYQLVNKFKWSRGYQGHLMAGWMALAPICGLLDFRPAVWLQGDSGTGKSYFIGSVLSPILGRTLENLVAMSTQAAMKRILHHGSTSFVIDENEAENEDERRTMDSILKIMRIASTEASGDVIKSNVGSNTEVIRTKMRAMMMFSSVGGRVTVSANTNRIMVLELMLCPEEERLEYYRVMDDLTKSIKDTDFSRDYLHFIMRNVYNLLEAVRIGKRVAAAKLHHVQRDADLVGSLVGAAFILKNAGALPSEKEVEQVLNDLVSDLQARETITDWEELLDEIRNIKVDLSPYSNATPGSNYDWSKTKTATIAEIVAQAHGGDMPLFKLKEATAADLLTKVGVVVYKAKGDPANSPKINRIWLARSQKKIIAGLARTRFAAVDYGRILARMPDSASPDAPKYLYHETRRVVDMPVNYLWPNYQVQKMPEPVEDDDDDFSFGPRT